MRDPNPESHETAPPDLGEIARVLMRRRRLLLLPWAAAMVLGVAAAFLLEPIYVSSVKLEIERPAALAGPLGGMVGSGVNPDQQALVMREQVQSTLFLRSVINATAIKSDPATRAWALKRAPRYPTLSGDDAIEAVLVDHLRDHVTIRADKGNIFVIIIEDLTAERARRLAAGLASQFVISSKAAQLEALRATGEFSVEQSEIYKHQLEEAEGRLEAARRAALSTKISGSSVTDANASAARGLLEQANVDVEDQRQRVADLRSRLAGKVRDNDPPLLSSPQCAVLSGQLIGLERQMAEALLSDPSGQSAVGLRVSLARKSADLEQEFESNAVRVFPALAQESRELLVRFRMVEADLAAKQSRQSYLSSQVSDYEHQVVLSPERELDLQHLQQDVDNKRALYNAFLTQSATNQIAEAFESAKISGRFAVLEPANLPTAPSKPNKLMLILLAFVVGGIVGVGSVLMVEQHDHSMKNAEEVERLLGLQVLGAVPRVHELERTQRRSRAAARSSGRPGPPVVPATHDRGLLHLLKTESPIGLEFRRIYLKLARNRGHALPHTLLVTSSTRGEGKTTTAACLAITLAREHRQKLLLVDFDLRSPALHRALGIPRSTWGLAQMLHHRRFDERFVRSTVMPNLDFLTAGKTDQPPSELVDGESVEWFLKEATARYPLVLLDTAPNLAVPDPLIIGRAVEGVIYVVKAGTTVRKAAEYGVKVQREARDNLLGVLMNDVGEFLPQYYGYRYNAYGYTGEVAGGES